MGLCAERVGRTDNRFIRESTQSSTAEVSLAVSGRSGSSDRCTVVSLATRSLLCFSSDDAPTAGDRENSTREAMSPALGGSHMAHDSVVSNASIPSDSCRLVSAGGATTLSAPLSLQHEQSDVALFGSVAHQLPRLRSEGFSTEVLQQLGAARVSSTNLTYESKWKLFHAFCLERAADPFSATSSLIAEFLVHVARTKSASVSTLAGYRSAIGNVLRLTTGFDPGTDLVLSQLMRSFKRTQPVPSRRIPQWDIGLVLEVLGSSAATEDVLDLRLLTAKTVFLVALASGDRSCALAALRFPPRESPSELTIEFLEKFVPKSYFVRKNMSRIAPLVLQRSLDQSLWQVCPYRAVQSYCDRVAQHRKPNQDSLFIPHNLSKSHNIKPQAIARYITTLITWCYEQKQLTVPKSRAHDVRKVATSMRELSATALSDVLSAGDWTTPHMFFAHYQMNIGESQQRALAPFQGLQVAKSSFSLQSGNTK